jgi:rhodanese-related sulfurtransferase
MEQITATELKSKLSANEDLIIIDVRESWEYDEVQLHPSARNYPLGSLPELLESLSELKEKRLVVHCRTGVRSNQAQKFLLKNGFSKVINLIGGIDEYITQ